MVAEFSITDEKGKVKAVHKWLMKETQKISEVMELFREDLKQLKTGLMEVKSLDKMSDEDKLVSQLMLRLTPKWREFAEEKLRSRKVTVEVWRDLEKLLKKQSRKKELKFPWSQEGEQPVKQPQQQQQKQPAQRAPAQRQGAGKKKGLCHTEKYQGKCSNADCQ